MKEMTDELIMSWDNIKDFLNPTIMKHFLKDGGKKDISEVDMSKYRNAEASVSGELRSYLPCFNKHSKGLVRIWASIFNFTFIGLANEKNDNGFSQITVNYNKALEWLNSDEAKKYCRSSDADLSISDFIVIGSTSTIKF